MAANANAMPVKMKDSGTDLAKGKRTLKKYARQPRPNDNAAAGTGPYRNVGKPPVTKIYRCHKAPNVVSIIAPLIDLAPISQTRK